MDFQDIEKLVFHQFCMKISSNSEIKKQIYSLQLSNKHTYCQIHLFLSFFSLDEFPHLRSLTLIEVKEHNVEQLKLMLPLISQLSCFCLIDYEDKKNEIVSALPKSDLRTLIIPELFSDCKLIYDISSIRSLTIFYSNTNEIHQILNSASRLKYLNVRLLKGTYSTTEDNEYSTKCHAIHLKQLIMKYFDGEFRGLITILKRTPNLNSLIISAYNNLHIIDANRWEYFITSSLPYLKIFKFEFKFHQMYSEKTNYNNKWKQFQNDFWHKQHHWYTEYWLSKDDECICTVPYISYVYRLASNMTRYYNELVNNSNIFENVTNLVLYHDVIIEKCQYHFPHVTSIIFQDPLFLCDNSFLFNEKHVENLKMIVNLSDVKHLSMVTGCKFETSSVLLKILKESPQLSSISINPDVLISFFDDDELCKYLNKMIKKLDLKYCPINSLNDLYKLDKLWRIFSNVEQVTCRIEELLVDCLLSLLEHLPKLSRIDVSSQEFFCYSQSYSFMEELRKLGIEIIIDIEKGYNSISTIWIIRDMS